MKPEKMRKSIENDIKNLLDPELQEKRRRTKENKEAADEEIRDTGL